MEYDIFISYSRKDTAIVDQFVNRLTKAGYSVWIDREGTYSGDQFATNIVEAIENSKILLFFSSANSNASEWTVREIYYAMSEHKTIIPIKIDTAKYDKRIALNLIMVDFIQYQNNDLTSAAERLIASVAKHLSKQSGSEQPKIHPKELFSLGKTHYDNKEYEQAVHWFRIAAEQGESNAQCYLGNCFGYGLGVQQDYQQAAEWYRKAAEQEHTEAQCSLGFYYERGHGVAIDYQQAVNWYKKAAERGNIEAQCSLGYCYERGYGVHKDYERAKSWYDKAAEKGLARAQYHLGVCYYFGRGVTQDRMQAVKWYHKAAEQGDADSQCSLGGCYYYGKGITPNYSKATEWYFKAAEQGNARAQFCLGVCYEKGHGLTQDTQQAINWYKKAAEQENEGAVEALKRLHVI